MIDMAIVELHFWAKVDMSGDCWMWTGAKFRNGYGRIRVGDRRAIAHRLAWQFLNGPIPAGLFVCHTCDVRACVNPEHLFLGTPKDNLQDASRKGRMRPGEKHPNVKLTEGQVREIRKLCAEGFSQDNVARMFKVNRKTVSAVVNRKTWKHI